LHFQKASALSALSGFVFGEARLRKAVLPPTTQLRALFKVFALYRPGSHRLAKAQVCVSPSYRHITAPKGLSMRPNFKAVPLAVLASGLALATVPALADTTYEYTGLDYNSFYTAYSGTNPYTSSMSLTGEFNVSSPLGDDLSDYTFTPISWEFNDGLYTYTPSSPGLASELFQVSTDASGNIDAWTVEIHFSPGGFADTGISGYDWVEDPYDLYGSYGNYNAYSFILGSWSEVPAGSPVPEPSGTLGFGLCALALGLFIRERRRNFCHLSGSE
jgi:hypothetical protein